MYFNMNGTNKGVDYGLVTLEIQGPLLMPPGLNSNGRTPPGLHGVAATPPGSRMFAHMRSLNNTTLARRLPTAGRMASLGRNQMAASPACQVGSAAATRGVVSWTEGWGVWVGVGVRGASLPSGEQSKQTPITFSSLFLIILFFLASTYLKKWRLNHIY